MTLSPTLYSEQLLSIIVPELQYPKGIGESNLAFTVSKVAITPSVLILSIACFTRSGFDYAFLR